MFKKLCLAALFTGIFAPALLAGSLVADAQEAKMHRVVIQVTEDDMGVMNRALGNAMNAQEYFAAKGEELTVEIVTYGPGITMLRDDISPVKDRIAEAKMSVPNLTLSMCNNSKMGAERREGKEIPVISSAQVVPAGIVRVMELQEEGYTYAKP
jgi:intracellular sulfur oxidation DsrE/DsrF family protein